MLHLSPIEPNFPFKSSWDQSQVSVIRAMLGSERYISGFLHNHIKFCTASAESKERHKDLYNREGDIMTDLTLDEFRGLSERELKQSLRENARNMFSPHSFEESYEERINGSDSCVSNIKGEEIEEMTISDGLNEPGTPGSLPEKRSPAGCLSRGSRCSLTVR